MPETFRIVISLDRAKTKPAEAFQQEKFFLYGSKYPDLVSPADFVLFHKLPGNRLLVGGSKFIDARNGKVQVNGVDVDQIMSIHNSSLEPVIFEVGGPSVEDRRLYMYPFPETGNPPKEIHTSFLKQPTCYYELGQDMSGQVRYRLKFSDNTPGAFARNRKK